MTFAIKKVLPSGRRSPADKFGNIEAPILFCVVLLLIGLINFIVFSVMDAKLDKQMGIVAGGESSEEFKVSDLGKIF